MMHATSWKTPIRDGDVTCPAGTVEIRDLARGVAGALFVSLPLLFTLEMWEIAKVIPDAALLAFLVVTFFLNKSYLDFAGFRRNAWQKSKWWDSVVTLGIGIVTSTLTLSVSGIIEPSLDLYLTAKTVALEAIPTSIGAAVAINQLGGGDGAEGDINGYSVDGKVLIGTALGAFLFSLNVAPTLEMKIVAIKQTWILVLATLLLSLGISYLTVALAEFEQRDLADRKWINSEWLEALISYLVAFAVGCVLLWLFGYATPLDPVEVWLPQAVVLSYATTLGGAAGRLVL